MTPLKASEFKQRLGIDRLALQIHDASFPSDPDEDWGRGSPYSYGAERLLKFAAELGFDTIQLGPQGMTDLGNSSPYDGTLFSRNPLNLPLGRMVRQGRLQAATLANLCHQGASRGHSSAALESGFQTALAEVVSSADASDQAAARQFLSDHGSWLIPDALYAVLCEEHGALWWGNWDRTPQGAADQGLFLPAGGQAAERRFLALQKQHAARIEEYALIQWLLEIEHRALRARVVPLGLSLFADLQVGLAQQDCWARQSLFLQNYRMGAPPSRTNPTGQPWGFSVLDPAQIGSLESPGPALEFVRARLRKVFNECDGVRIDHPHGWIDPWVYLSGEPDPFHAVQSGARLYSTPNDSRHSELKSYAVARSEQVDLSQPAFGDLGVSWLDEDQVARYALLVEVIIEQAIDMGRSRSAIACEVLSTLPYPVRRVLEKYGLGRFRVVQKANLHELGDVYRIENAQPQDWIMMSTHDTPTVWQLADAWTQEKTGRLWGEYLADRLGETATRDPFAAQIAESPARLVHALFAAMLASHARQVVVFFPDLFGMRERYNLPGLVSESNWRIRLPGSFVPWYEERLKLGQALDLNQCFNMALRAMSAPAS